MALSQLNFEGKNKIEVAIERIKYFESPEGYQLAFSGGKDSVVIYDLAVKAGVKFTAFYNWTGIDPPELYRFVRQFYPGVVTRKPEKTIWELIQEHGILPTRERRFCCEYLKERPTDEGWLIVGVRWQESPRRRRYKMVDVCTNTGKRVVHVHPILDWSEAEVWEYIRQNKLPYCSLYDEGFRRIGCILCPFVGGRHLRQQMERYPKYAQMWKNACERLHASGKGGKWQSGEEMFNWWITRGHKPSRESGCQGRFV